MLSLYGPLSTQFSVIARLEQAIQDANVAEISFREIEFTNDICQALAKLLHCDDREFTQVELYYCRGQIPAALRDLIFSNCVQSLCLFAGSVDNEICQAICQGLQEESSNNCLVKLRFNTQLSQENITTIFQGLNTTGGSCRELTLSGSNIQDDAIPAFAAGLRQNDNLQTLALGQCYLEDEFMVQVLSALENHHSLRELSLYGNGCHSESLRVIGKLLTTSRTLESLDLTWQLGEDGKPPPQDNFDLSPLATGLATNTTLTYLNLSRNPHITDQGIRDLATALIHNSTLYHLLLRGCNISDAGLQSLASILSENHGLKKLWLQSSQTFGEKGVHFLLEGLRHNVHLKEIALPDNEYDHEKEMQHFLDVNRCGGRRLLQVANCPLSSSFWPFVLERVGKQDIPLRGFVSMEESKRQTAIRRANVVYYCIREGLLLER
jgi:hypothetical protein